MEKPEQRSYEQILKDLKIVRKVEANLKKYGSVQHPFWSRDPKHFTYFPRWVGIVVYAFLAALVLFALYSIGQ